MSTNTDLALLPPKETALQVYSAPSGLDPYIELIRKEALSHAPDTSTKKGRDHIASIAFKVRKSKTALDGLGKQLVDDMKEVPKKIDAERKRMRDALDSLADEVRRPLTEWEEAEEARQQKHRLAIELMQQSVQGAENLTSGTLREQIAALNANVIDAAFEEYEAEAHRAKAKALEGLSAALETREKHEAEQAELARLRAEAAAREQKEREERIAREAAERAQREAEARAQAEREAVIRREAEAKAAADKRELELKLSAERAEREKAEAVQREQQAKADAERRAAEAVAAEQRRVAQQQAAEAAEAKRREADKAHKAAVNRAALAAFVAGGMTEECAKQAITLIAKKAIPAVSITY